MNETLLSARPPAAHEGAALNVANASLRDDERGQISILFVIGVVALVFLIALIYNTSKQTTRKIEMQGAADSAAVAGGVWVARGMNLMVLNNNGMADILSVMITVRALLETAQLMQKLLPGMILAAEAFPPTMWMGPILAGELARYNLLIPIMKKADSALSGHPSGLGWRIMSALDRFNQIIKTVIPFVAQEQAISFARRNGADFPVLPGLLIPGQEGSLTRPLPLFPVGRGPQGLLAARADQCQLPKLKRPAIILLALTGPLSSPVAILIFNQMLNLNVGSLGGTAAQLGRVTITKDDVLRVRDDDGRSVEDMVEDYNKSREDEESGGEQADISQFKFKTFSSSVFEPPLTWPSNPPRPMTLTDQPRPAGAATTNVLEQNVNLTRVRKHLQFLGVAFGRLPRGSAIGGERFPNPSPYPWFTYAQSDVYNPTRWGMFTQDWRAKLARARLFNEKVGEISQKVGLRISNSRNWTFVNNH
jgi:hypothetical protein